LSTAASLAKYFIEHKSAVGLFVNTCLADSDRPVSIPPGSGSRHLVGILEALAKVTPGSSGPLTDLIQGEQKNLPWGTTLIFILSKATTSISRLHSALKERWHKSITINVGERDWENEDTPNHRETVEVISQEKFNEK
jgi:uncharacterized protein (DUF58 family)